MGRPIGTCSTLIRSWTISSATCFSVRVVTVETRIVSPAMRRRTTEICSSSSNSEALTARASVSGSTNHPPLPTIEKRSCSKCRLLPRSRLCFRVLHFRLSCCLLGGSLLFRRFVSGQFTQRFRNGSPDLFRSATNSFVIHRLPSAHCATPWEWVGRGECPSQQGVFDDLCRTPVTRRSENKGGVALFDRSRCSKCHGSVDPVHCFVFGFTGFEGIRSVMPRSRAHTIALLRLWTPIL